MKDIDLGGAAIQIGGAGEVDYLPVENAAPENLRRVLVYYGAPRKVDRGPAKDEARQQEQAELFRQDMLAAHERARELFRELHGKEAVA